MRVERAGRSAVELLWIYQISAPATQFSAFRLQTGKIGIVCNGGLPPVILRLFVPVVSLPSHSRPAGKHRQHSNTRFTENGTTTIRKFSFPFHQPSEPDTTNHCESKHGAFVFLRYFILNLLGFMPARPQCITNPATFTSTWPQHSLFPCASQPSTCHKSNSQFPSLNHTRKERGLTTLFRN